MAGSFESNKPTGLKHEMNTLDQAFARRYWHQLCTLDVAGMFDTRDTNSKLCFGALHEDQNLLMCLNGISRTCVLQAKYENFGRGLNP